MSSRMEILKQHGPGRGFLVRALQLSPAGTVSHALLWFSTREQAETYIYRHQAEESAMKSSVVDNFRDPEETAIPVEASDKRQQPKPTRPALGDLFLVPDSDHEMAIGPFKTVAIGPFKTEDEAIAAAKDDFTESDPEGDERYFLCRIAKKLRLFRPVQVDEEESEDR